MCLPFCCGGDDPGPQQPTKTAAPTNQREDPGRGANNGAVGESKNGASDTNKNGGHTPAVGGLDADVPPSDGQGPNNGALGKTGLPSQAAQAPEPKEHGAVGPRHDAPVAASKPKEATEEKMKAPTAAQIADGGEDGYHSTAAASPSHRVPREAGEKMSNPPVQKMARRREDDDSYSTATAGPRHHGPVVASRPKEATDAADVPAPAAGNAHGGHDDHADGHGGQDDRKTWGKPWR